MVDFQNDFRDSTIRDGVDDHSHNSETAHRVDEFAIKIMRYKHKQNGEPRLTGTKWNLIKAELITMWQIVKQVQQLQAAGI